MDTVHTMSEQARPQTHTQPVVVHNTAGSRYEIVIDGEVCAFAEYRLDGNVMTFFHTVTKPAERGRGLAAMVVGRALDDAQADGRRVVPQCWYVAQFIDQHPDFADLVG